MNDAQHAQGWLELDAADLRRTGRIRLIAAVVTAGATLWLRLVVPHGWVWIVVLASFMACTYWLRSYLKLRHAPPSEAIYTDDKGFYRRVGAQTLFVPWSSIVEVSLDEERGAVVLKRRDEAPIVLQNRYGKMGLEDLYARIERRRSECHNQPEHHAKI